MMNGEPARYYLAYSSAFDYAPFVYFMDEYKAAAKRAGGLYVKEARQFGWFNQPLVVTWTATEEINKAIERELYELPPFCNGVSGLPKPIIVPV